MKDWKAEYDKLKGELAEVRVSLQYERNKNEQRELEAIQIRERFKDLLIDVLGR